MEKKKNIMQILKLKLSSDQIYYLILLYNDDFLY